MLTQPRLQGESVILCDSRIIQKVHDMSNGRELAGKVGLVTGAGKNIGRSIAIALADAGAAVAVNTRASKDDAEKVAKEINSAGGKAQVFMADIVDPKAVN